MGVFSLLIGRTTTDDRAAQFPNGAFQTEDWCLKCHRLYLGTSEHDRSFPALSIQPHFQLVSVEFARECLGLLPKNRIERERVPGNLAFSYGRGLTVPRYRARQRAVSHLKVQHNLHSVPCGPPPPARYWALRLRNGCQGEGKRTNCQTSHNPTRDSVSTMHEGEYEGSSCQVRKFVAQTYALGNPDSPVVTTRTWPGLLPVKSVSGRSTSGARHPPRICRRVTWSYFARCRRARIDTDELLQASLRSQSRRARRGASLLAQIIVGKFASYPLIDGATLSIRRVEYDMGREVKALGRSGLPRADWIAKTLPAAASQMP